MFALPAALCLITCLTAPIFYFQGVIGQGPYRLALSAATVGYFICAALMAARRKR
jgi:hypothetical protein